MILAADGPRIIDFGIARAVGATAGITTAGAVMGTAAYLSPEQVHGNPAGPASDVFALGCVLAYAATGRPPFAGEPPDLAGLDDAGLAALINSCLAKSAADRPEVPAILTALSGAGLAPVAARAAAAAVPAAVDHGASTQTSPSVRGRGDSGRVPRAACREPCRGTRGRRSGRRVAVLIGVIAAAAVALAVVLSVSLSGGSKPQATASHRPLAAGPVVSSAGATPGQSRPPASAPSSTAAKHGKTPAKRSTLAAPAVSHVKVTGSGLTLEVTAAVKDAGQSARCSISVSGGKSASGALRAGDHGRRPDVQHGL